MDRRGLRWLGWGVIASATVWLASSFVVLGALKQPRGRVEAEPRPDARVKAELGAIRELRLRTSDGEELGAWFVEASREDAPSVLELHGLGGRRAARLPAARVLRELGSAVLLVTLRAHGDSTGDTIDFGWSSRLDVLAAVEWLERERPGRPVVVHGASMGAAAAVFAAGELGTRVSGYALESLFRDLETATWNRCRIHLPPVADGLAYAGLQCAAALVWPEWKRVSAVDAIANVPREVPVLLLAGSDDLHATSEEQRDLLARVEGHGELVVIDGADHDRLQAADPAAYREAVLGWLDRTVREAR